MIRTNSPSSVCATTRILPDSVDPVDDETMFFQGVIRVRNRIRKWIAKNRRSFVERDAVLNQITRGFLLVPCKAHRRTIAALSLFLPLVVNQKSARTRKARTCAFAIASSEVCPIGKHAGKFKDFGQPAAIILTLKFDGECHAGITSLQWWRRGIATVNYAAMSMYEE
jgi:hypothetical protein